MNRRYLDQCLNCVCVSDPGVFKRYPATQVQQPMCLHKISWRDSGADLPTVPPFFNSHFTRTTLYIPAPGMLSWECDRQPWRCLHLAQWGYESRRDDPAVEFTWIIGTLGPVYARVTLSTCVDSYPCLVPLV